MSNSIGSNLITSQFSGNNSDYNMGEGRASKLSDHSPAGTGLATEREEQGILLFMSRGSEWYQGAADIAQRPEVYSNNNVFDWEFYASQNPDLANAGITTEAGLKNHWLSYGIHEGRQGSARFNSKWYTDRYPDLGLNGVHTQADALRHYADYGRAEGRKTSSLTSDVALSHDLNMDIYQPVNLEGKKVPIVINLVGGGWASAEKDHPSMQTMGKEFAKNGIAMISPEYHTAPSHTYPAQMQDIDSVLKYVKDHAAENNWDLDNITLAGGSAGGHLVLQHTMNPRFDNNPELPKVKNVIAIAPATDLTIKLDGTAKTLVSNFLGTENAAVEQEASPITYVNQPSDKRFYFTYGLQDTTTNPETQAIPFFNQMDDAGQDIKIVSHNAKHGDWIAPNQEHYDSSFVFDMAQWIKEA